MARRTRTLARVGQLQNLMTKLAEASAFVVPEIQAIDDARWEKFVADPALKDWKVPLHKIRRMRSHVLSDKRRGNELLALGARTHDDMTTHTPTTHTCHTNTAH